MEPNTASPAEEKAPAWGEETYTLLYPIPLGNGAELKTLTFREPSGVMLEEIEELGMKDGEEPTIKQALGLIRIMSGQTKAVTDQMHKKDILGASQKIGPLLE